MKQTEALLRASKKYHEKLENIQLRVPKGEYRRARQGAGRVHQRVHLPRREGDHRARRAEIKQTDGEGRATTREALQQLRELLQEQSKGLTELMDAKLQEQRNDL